MKRQVRYYCPEDTSQVLYCEVVDDTMINVGLIALVDLPETCPKCGKAYYKWQCISDDDLDDLSVDED